MNHKIYRSLGLLPYTCTFCPLRKTGSTGLHRGCISHGHMKGSILGPWGHMNEATTNWSIVKLILYIYNKQTSSVKFLSFKDLKIHQLCTNANASHIGFSSVAREMLHTNTRVNANSNHTTLLSNTLTELQVYWYLAKIQDCIKRELTHCVTKINMYKPI